jgi:hypothetical protein
MGSLRRIASKQTVIEGILQRLLQADVDVVHCLLAKATLGQLPIQASDLKSIDSLQSHLANSRVDVFVNAHAVITSRIRTQIATCRKPLFEVITEGDPRPLYVCPVGNRGLKLVHGFKRRGLRLEAAASSLLAVLPHRQKVDDERPHLDELGPAPRGR